MSPDRGGGRDQDGDALEHGRTPGAGARALAGRKIETVGDEETVMVDVTGMEAEVEILAETEIVAEIALVGGTDMYPVAEIATAEETRLLEIVAVAETGAEPRAGTRAETRAETLPKTRAETSSKTKME